MALVASLYNLPPRVLPSIQAVEGGKAGTVHRNRDGTDDLGVMQINARWIPAFAAFTGLPANAVRERLITRPCFNIAAAGAILHTYLDKADGDLMKAVGFYHSHTGPLSDHYRGLVIASAARMFGAPRAASLPRTGGR
jgi:hypothetical protein